MCNYRNRIRESTNNQAMVNVISSAWLFINPAFLKLQDQKDGKDKLCPGVLVKLNCAEQTQIKSSSARRSEYPRNARQSPTSPERGRRKIKPSLPEGLRHGLNGAEWFRSATTGNSFLVSLKTFDNLFPGCLQMLEFTRHDVSDS